MGRNEEKNLEQRQETINKIELGSLYYFAKYGLAGTKISDLSKYLGISQGLLYRYYSSKEELFKMVSKKWIETRDNNMQGLVDAPMKGKDKILFLTNYVKNSMGKDKKFASFFTIFENDSLISGTKEGTLFHTWSNEPTLTLAKIIEQGQQEGDVHQGNSYQMAISYWGLVFAISHNYIASETVEWCDFNMLNRLLIKNM
ncbi:MAG: TetR/AcrR family transcriptional regulator [Roseburia sp.]|nr:TetR/AcrR family transcriptional regulator [Anaeroplasma bactoclasticum]MCM1197114.1 TetR/AcrR family transcriptional regulator [Roseburia sp.]MCM1556703.1 TetR/AcrR family transcriptional regulator [Anaeroplasma bactoclasticum]